MPKAKKGKPGKSTAGPRIVKGARVVTTGPTRTLGELREQMLQAARPGPRSKLAKDGSFVKAALEIHERCNKFREKHPETIRGFTHTGQRKLLNTFFEQEAKRLGVSERYVYSVNQIVETLSPEAVEALEGSHLDSFFALRKMADGMRK